jgi:hypothetical protein
MHIYESIHIGKLTSINAHLRTTTSIYAHLRKATSVYARFCKCAFMEVGFQIYTYTEARIYGSQLP